jgi:hypothetical protein
MGFIIKKGPGMGVNFKLLVLKLSIVLVPSYSVAYLTDKMVYVVPTLAAAPVVASSIENSPSKKRGSARVDEEGLDSTGADAGID